MRKGDWIGLKDGREKGDALQRDAGTSKQSTGDRAKS